MSNDSAKSDCRRWAFCLVGCLLGGSVVGLWPATKAAPPSPEPLPAPALDDDERTTVDLFRTAAPSVVYITTLTRRLNLWTRDVSEIPQGTGTGFLWDQKGHVVTNFHVLRGASSAKITLHDQTEHSAKLVGYSPDHDLAVLKIDVAKQKLQPVPLGRSANLLVGQKAFAIGNPFGLDHTLTTGIISALNRTIQSVSKQSIEGVIQTDAAINPGNSGGPLLDRRGQLIGINTAIFSPSGADAGMRLRISEWMFFEQDSMLTGIGRRRFAIRVAAADPAVIEFLGTLGNQALDALERTLKGQPWLAGDAPTIADICVYAYARLAEEADYDMSSRPSVGAWRRRLEALPGWAAPESLLAR